MIAGGTVGATAGGATGFIIGGATGLMTGGLAGGAVGAVGGLASGTFWGGISGLMAGATSNSTDEAARKAIVDGPLGYIGGGIFKLLGRAVGSIGGKLLRPATKKVHVDIGGKGRYPGAINVNPSPTTSTTGTPGCAIPNRLAGVGEKLPQRNKSVDLISVENTPISPCTASEIARVIKSGREIRLVGPADYARVAHQLVIQALPPGATVTQTTVGTGETAITTTVIKLP